MQKDNVKTVLLLYRIGEEERNKTTDGSDVRCKIPKLTMKKSDSCKMFKMLPIEWFYLQTLKHKI